MFWGYALGKAQEFAAETAAGTLDPMLQLVLLRHAKAAADSDTGEDFDRALAARGREDAPVVAKALADAGASRNWCSFQPLSGRARRGSWCRLRFPALRHASLDELYHATAETLLHMVEHASVDRLMIVGHNPGLQELAIRLARRNTPLDAAVRTKFPTCAAALYSRKDLLGALKLQEFITPKNASE